MSTEASTWRASASRICSGAEAHFAALAEAIDTGFARGPRTPERVFRLADERRIGRSDADRGDDEILDARRTKLSLLAAGDSFLYVFDFGGGWHHLCTVSEAKMDPLDELHQAGQPAPYWGWGDLPDQYGRRWAEDGARPWSRRTQAARTAAVLPMVGPRRRLYRD